MRRSSQEQVIFTQKYLQMFTPDANVLVIPDTVIAATHTSEASKGEGAKG